MRKEEREIQAPIPRLWSTREREITTTNPSIQAFSNVDSLKTMSTSMGQVSAAQGQPSCASADMPLSQSPIPGPHQEVDLDRFDIDAVIRCLEAQDFSRARAPQHEFVTTIDEGPMETPFSKATMPPLSDFAEGWWVQAPSETLEKFVEDPSTTAAPSLPAAPTISWISHEIPTFTDEDDICRMSSKLFNSHPSELPLELQDALKILVTSAKEDFNH